MNKKERVELLVNIVAGIQGAKFPMGATVGEIHGFLDGMRNVCSALVALRESIEKDKEEEVPKVENDG